MPLTNAEAVGADKALSQSLSRRWGVPASVRRSCLQCACVLAAALLSFLVISHFVVQSVEVVGSSMSPTLHSSERLLLNRWVYYLHSPKAGDIVVLRDPADGGLSVKRIIAVPGQTVYLSGGKVIVNGRLLAEPYLPARTHTYPDGKLKEQWLRCGQRQYIVMGDNRMNSADSRSYGPVSRQNILGMLIR